MERIHRSHKGNRLWMALMMTSVLMLLSAELVFTSPMHRCDSKCLMCSPGEYLRTKCECVPCPVGSYTTDKNCEPSCHRCYSDCRSEYNLKVVQNCTSTSDLKCECEKGFSCTDKDSSGNCKHCQRIHDSTTTGQQTTLAPSCNFPKCSTKRTPDVITEPSTDTTKIQLAISCLVAFIGFIAAVLFFVLRCRGDDTCFKRTMKKLSNVEVKATSQQFSRDSFSAKQQPVPMAAANLGPVHVHNPGTVIFSLLSQFTGQVGATKVEKTDMDVNREDEMDCSVCHSPSSPSIPLSEEEHRGETDSIFFPSQEEGKDHCVSKEEML